MSLGGLGKATKRSTVSPRPGSGASGPERAPSNDRGVVAIEFVVVLPVLIFLFLGLLEAGTAWLTRANLTEGLRSSTYRAAVQADEPGGDLAVMQSLLAELGTRNAAQVVSVTVYDPATADLNLCQSFGTVGGFGDCVVYDTQTLLDVADGTVTLVDFGGTACNGTHLDNVWCSTERTSIDRIAVRVEYQHQWISGIFPGGGIRLHDSSILRTL